MKFNPDNLETTFVEPMTPFGPIENRKYTLTHSDETSMMFLTIADFHDYNAINKDMRDELLGSWKISEDDSYRIYFYAYVGETDFISASIKYGAFKYHMKLALEAIFYGDRDLFIKNPNLLNTPVFVKFDSSIPMFDNYESYGYVKDYLSIK